jgi:hypothetical protein
MKLLFIITFVFLSNLTFAQSDSTQLKLENYKKWFESGLISQDEYSDLKKNLLKVSPSNFTQNKDSLKRKNAVFKGQIKAGAIFTLIGLSAFIGSNPYLNNLPSTSVMQIMARPASQSRWTCRPGKLFQKSS